MIIFKELLAADDMDKFAKRVKKRLGDLSSLG